MKNEYDVIIIGSGPAGLGSAFYIAQNSNKRVLLIEKRKISSGGLRNDCKQNYTYPVGFPKEYWSKEQASELLKEVAEILNPKYEPKDNIDIYKNRAKKLGVELLEIAQAHVGTDKALYLIKELIKELENLNVTIKLETEVKSIDENSKEVILSSDERVAFKDVIIAPGRAGFEWLQDIMKELNIDYVDNVVDVGIRVEAKASNYPIVKDYYDPKFLFPDGVRTFCTNSGSAHIVKEKYKNYYSINGHSYSTEKEPNGLVNFAMLKTITLTDPIVSGQKFAQIMGEMAMQLSGGKPMMQRVGDFRLGVRSKRKTFNNDLYYFEPSMKGATPGDVSLAIPAKILRDIWKSLKMLDTIVPGILHPSTIIYYPEIKTYANKPVFLNEYFMVKDGIYIIGDGAGTSRGITAAWASGIRAGKGVVSNK